MKPTHRSKFTPAEDTFLKVVVTRFGISDWSLIAKHMGTRTARQCRDRWKHYLCPSTNTSDWTPAEDILLIKAHENLGRHWGHISTLFPGRTSINVRNRYCKLAKAGNCPCDSSNDSSEGEGSQWNSNSSEYETMDQPLGQAKTTLPPISSFPFCTDFVNCLPTLPSLEIDK